VLLHTFLLLRVLESLWRRVATPELFPQGRQIEPRLGFEYQRLERRWAGIQIVKNVLEQTGSCSMSREECWDFDKKKGVFLRTDGPSSYSAMVRGMGEKMVTTGNSSRTPPLQEKKQRESRERKSCNVSNRTSPTCHPDKHSFRTLTHSLLLLQASRRALLTPLS